MADNKFVRIFSDKQHIRIEDKSTRVTSYMLKSNLVIQKDNDSTFFLKNDSYVKYIKFGDVALPHMSDDDGIDKLISIIIDMMNTEVYYEIITVNEMEQADIVLDLSVNTDKNEYHITEKKTGGQGGQLPTITHDPINHYVDMKINSTDGSEDTTIVRQSKAYMNIPSGKLNIALVSGVLLKNDDGLDPITGIYGIQAIDLGNSDHFISKIGIFDSDDGLFVQYKAEKIDPFKPVLSIVKMFGGVKIFEIFQEDWNVDTCDSQGPSGITLNAGEMNTFIFRQGTLPKTFMQVGVMNRGAAVLIHEFTDSLYFVKLPLRWEVSQTNSTLTEESSLSMVQNNAVVLSNEKHYSQTTHHNYICKDNHFRKINDTFRTDVIFDIRLNEAHNRSKLKLEKIHIINKETSGIVLWKLFRNGTLYNALIDPDDSNLIDQGPEYNPSNPELDDNWTATISHAHIISLESSQTYNTGSGDIDYIDYLTIDESTASLISSGYIYGNNVTEINLESDTNVIYSDIEGVSDHLTLVAYYVNAPAELQATITWKEYE
tara:strand:+ start:1143 stop:2774 length:1632 start_codon:yes stop_codon:yes gene_type:complete